MTVYKIERFDVAMFGINKIPIIYIKPYVDVLEFSNYLIKCEINGTGKEYDGKKIPYIINSSEEVPSKRPNFFKKTGLYVVTLLCNWYGYPDDLSSCYVTFYQSKPDNHIPKNNYIQKDNYIHRGPIKEDFSDKKIQKHKKEPNKNDNLIKIITLVFVLMIITCVIYFLIKQNISRV
jgi:hypothetical protein